MPFKTTSKIDCKWVSKRFSVYLDAALPNEERILIHEHLRFCEECSKEFQDLNSTITLLSDFAEETTPDEIRTFRLPRSTFVEIFPTIHDDKPTLTFGIWVPYLSALVLFFMVLTAWASLERLMDKQYNSSNYVEVFASQ
jgi:predicted anti-sigma-YlaC factor YlaD